MNAERKKALEANLWKIRLWQFLTWALFFIPVIIPFLQSRSLTLVEIFTLQSVFAVTIVVLELPTGYFADVYGRKLSLVLGTVFLATGTSIFMSSHSYAGFIIGEALVGVGSAFNSGAWQAALYETLAELGRAKEYVKVNGRMQFIARISEGAAAVVGGLLAVASFVFPFVASLVFLAIAFVTACSLVEAKRTKHVGDHVSHLISIFVDTLHRNRALKWILLFSVVAGISTRLAVWMYQPLFTALNFSYAWFGFLWAATLFISGIVSFYTYKIDDHISRLWGFALVLLVTIIGFFGIAVSEASLFALFFVVFVQAGRGLQSPLIDDQVQELISDDRRATVFSIRSLLHNVIYACCMPLLGFVATGNLFLGFAAAGVGTLVLGGAIWLRLYSLRSA